MQCRTYGKEWSEYSSSNSSTWTRLFDADSETSDPQFISILDPVIKYYQVKDTSILILEIVFIFAVHLSLSNFKTFPQLYIEQFFLFHEYQFWLK